MTVASCPAPSLKNILMNRNLDLLQWPAMLVTVIAAWFVASSRATSLGYAAAPATPLVAARAASSHQQSREPARNGRRSGPPPPR